MRMVFSSLKIIIFLIIVPSLICMILYLDAFCYLHFAVFFRHSLWPIRTDPRPILALRHTSWEPLFSSTLRWRLLSPLNASIVPLPFIIVHFHSAVALIVLICCIRNVLQNEKIKSVLWQSCSINNETRSLSSSLSDVTFRSNLD